MKQNSKTLIKVLIFLLLYFLTQTLITAIFAAIGGMGVEGDIQGAMETYIAENAALISLVHNALVILLILLYCRRSAETREDIRLRSIRCIELTCCAATGVCAAFIVVTLLSLLPIPGELMSSYSSAITASTAGAPPVRFLSVVIVAPIAEELLFRGVIYGAFRRTSRRGVAIAASCAIFGIMHQNPVWMVYAFLMGLGLTLTLDACGSLFAATALHMAFNLAGSYLAPLMYAMPIYIHILLALGCGYIVGYCIRRMKELPKPSTDTQSEKEE